MIGWLVGWFKALCNAIKEFWILLPDSVKEIIINAIVDAFESLFRNYYKAYKEEKLNG